MLPSGAAGTWGSPVPWTPPLNPAHPWSPGPASASSQKPLERLPGCRARLQFNLPRASPPCGQ